MMREARNRMAAVIHAQEDGAAAGGCMSGTTASSSEESSLFSSTSSLTDGEEGGDDDGATSSPPPDRRRVSSSSSSSSSLASSESETLQMDGADRGPLHELSTMLDHLPALRTGLSKYYQGRSQSFTSLPDVSCVEDLAKKTTPYIRRPKASRHYAAPLGVKIRLSKTVGKKATRSRTACIPGQE